MRHKKLFIVLAVLAMISVVGATAAFAASNATQTNQPAAADEVGLVIVSVDPDGPAAAAGVARGDILLFIGGEATNSNADVTKAVASLTAGDDVDLVVTHGDDERTLTVTTGDRNGRAYLGIQPYYGMQQQVAPQMGVVPPATTAAGATIVDVVADGPAGAAGVQPGDVIVSVNGEALSASNTLADAIAAMQPGDTATLEVQRSGENDTLSVDVTLSENPDKAGVAFLGVQYSQSPDSRMNRMPFGGQTMPSMPGMPFSDHGNMPFGDVEAGVVVVSVAADSPAAAAGLAEGDVIVAINGVDVTTPEEVVAIVGDAQPGDVITVSVQQETGAEADEADQSGQADTGETEQVVDLQVTLGARPDDATRAFLGVSLGAYESMHSQEGFPDQGMFQFPLPSNPGGGQPDNGAAPSNPGQPQSPLDLLEQLFPGLTSQQNS